MSDDNRQNVQWAKAPISDVPRDRLMMRLDFYQENLILKGYEGEMVWTRRISADSIATALMRHMGARSGLLPPDALWWKQSSEGTITALWREPRVWAAALQEKAFEKPARFQLPMPGLVFICAPGRPPWVFAARERPTSPEDQLYHTPTFNVFQDGRVCPGNHAFPERPEDIPESFFQSHFSMTGHTEGRSKKHRGELIQLWEEINGQDEYPLEDLVECATLEEVMGIPDLIRRRH